MSIASAIQTAQGRVAAAYTACNDKGATMPATANQNLSNLATTIETISTGGGGGSVESKDVDFIDYDGTLVASYTAAEFAALTALPANPSHTGLTAQGWNWSLSNAKTHVSTFGKLIIGQNYVTSSGKTEIDIELHEGRLSPYLGISIHGTVVIDWGDNSSTTTITDTSITISQKRTQHIYPAAGKYTITIDVTDGWFQFYNNNNYYPLLSNNNSTVTNNYIYSQCVRNIRLGNNVRVGSYGFCECHKLRTITLPSSLTVFDSSACSNCYSLKSITIPYQITSIATYAMRYCYEMSSISIPNSVTSIGNEPFGSCRALTSLILPAGVTRLGSEIIDYTRIESFVVPNGCSLANKVFNYCQDLSSLTLPNDLVGVPSSMCANNYSLFEITIPSSVTSIGASAFNNCRGISRIYFMPATPPTLANTNAFTNIASDCVFYVPNGCLKAYQTASNWSTYASRMVEMPA